jgi:hypothetical protein
MASSDEQRAHPLQGRRVVIATMHGKEAVLVPPLARALGIDAVVPADFDTDRFGTFTREVERFGTPLEAARRKARAAMAATGLPTAIASEGSFGPHPQLGIVPLGQELVLLLDDELGLEVVAEDHTTETNFASAACTSMPELTAFAERVGFPGHRVVLTVRGEPTATVRGLGEPRQLAAEFERLRAHYGTVTAETDMRADRNPTRMRAIARAAERLAERALARCPACRWPGHGVVDAVRGLPCELCGEPSDLVLALVVGCARCGARSEAPRPDGRTTCDPGHCAHCNP